MRRASFTDAEVLSSFPKQECWSTALAVSWPWRDCGCFHLGQADCVCVSVCDSPCFINAGAERRKILCVSIHGVPLTSKSTHFGPCFEILELGHENICPPPAGAEGGQRADVVPQGAGEGALSVSGVGLSSYTALAGVGQGWGGQWHLLSGEFSCYPSSKCL